MRTEKRIEVSLTKEWFDRVAKNTEGRKRLLSVRLYDDEYEALKKLCRDKMGTSEVSTVVRELLKQVLISEGYLQGESIKD